MAQTPMIIRRLVGGDVRPEAIEQALQRFHVVTPEGQLLSGGAAFSRLWCYIRAFRYFGLVFRLSPFAWMLDPIYDQFLKIRPWMQSRLR